MPKQRTPDPDHECLPRPVKDSILQIKIRLCNCCLNATNTHQISQSKFLTCADQETVFCRVAYQSHWASLNEMHL